MKKVLAGCLAIVAAAVVFWLSNRPPPAEPRGTADNEPASGNPQSAAILESDPADGKARESRRHQSGEIEKHQQAEKSLRPLREAVADQAEKVQERRVNLSRIIRASYKAGEGDDNSAAILKVSQSQDYIDAKRDFETDQALLEQMKLILIEKQAAGN